MPKKEKSPMAVKKSLLKIADELFDPVNDNSCIKPKDIREAVNFANPDDLCAHLMKPLGIWVQCYPQSSLPDYNETANAIASKSHDPDGKDSDKKAPIEKAPNRESICNLLRTFGKLQQSGPHDREALLDELSSALLTICENPDCLIPPNIVFQALAKAIPEAPAETTAPE